MSKTVEEWLNELPEPYRTRALDQCECLDEPCDSVYEAVNSLEWDITDEGSVFWQGVADHYDDPDEKPLPQAGALALRTQIKSNELWRYERIKALAGEILRLDDAKMIKQFVREMQTLI